MNLKELAIIATADTPVLRNTYVTLRGRYARTRRHSETGAIADSHYSKGDWLTQRTFSDAGRYGVIVEWIRRLAPQGPVLDIGAGDGLLSDALSPDVDYLGVDYAPATIDAMNAQFGGPKRRFVVGDATSFTPDRKYPIILFNDMLYFLTDPVAALRRMVPYLAPGGVFVVAMYLTGVQIRLLHELLGAFDAVEQSYFRNIERRCFVQVVLKPR